MGEYDYESIDQSPFKEYSAEKITGSLVMKIDEIVKKNKLTKKNYSWYRDLIVYSITTIRSVIVFRDVSIFKDLSYFPLWRKFRISNEGTLEHETPWLVFTSIKFLRNYLQKDMIVFEYGSGGSTEFLRKRVRLVISIEHDKEWYEKVHQYFRNEKVINAELKLISPEKDEKYASKNANIPLDCISSRTEYRGMSFKKYVTSISNYPDEYFDLIVVDGRSRISCLAYSIPKLKKNGILLLDNADRCVYLKPFPELQNKNKWSLEKFTGHFPFASASNVNQTNLFKKLY